MAKRPKGKGERNSERRNGKAWKKRPRKNKSTGRTIGGYTRDKLALRAKKRERRDHDPRVTTTGQS